MHRILTPRLELVPATIEFLRAELTGREALERALSVKVPASWPPDLYDDDALAYMLRELLEHPDDGDWGLYYFALRSALVNGEFSVSPLLIGVGGFKGAPDLAGYVEIGYSIVASHHGQGYATEAVGGLLEHAFNDPRVKTVFGHTLPSLAPSIRVLEKAGFNYVGLGADPDAPVGIQVVRYELAREDYHATDAQVS